MGDRGSRQTAANERILIIKLGALGDVVMATALVDAICAHHGAEHCCVLTTPPFAALFGAWPRLEVQTMERRGVAAMWRMLRFIRRGHYRRIYDLQGNDRTAMLCALSGVAERVGNHARYPYTHHPRAAWRGQEHIFSRMVAVLASAGVNVTASLPVIDCDEPSQLQVDAWLTRNHLRAPAQAGQAFVLLHAGASPGRPEKRWPHFAAFAHLLMEAGVTPVWLGGEADRSVNRALAAECGIDATGVFSLPQLVALGRHARAAVTNDSGPMHVLAAAGIPVFGLFGPSDWQRNHALGQREHVIACTDILPEHHGQRTADCLDAIGAPLVLARLRSAGVLG